MLQLVTHVLAALAVDGSVGASSAAAAEDDDDGPPDMGMDAGCCRVAGLVARLFERRGEVFGAEPRSAGRAPSIDLLAGQELRMQRLRLPRQACLLVHAHMHMHMNMHM